ncbi:kelch repeat-containing protein [Aquisphaera insulae]|uniref:kelch repeat-containing protein n=1 Tax=Aquisphaera insulae TaxID=2712864 RepID=UPI0013EB3F57|nr:kelch repeat-containing protein [Aquisphaera insulae]
MTNTRKGANSAMEPIHSTRPRGAAFLAGIVGLALLAPSPAQAHFLWLKAGQQGARPEVRAFLSETPEPDDAALLRVIEKAKISERGRTLSWKKETDTFLVGLGDASPAWVDGDCDLGYMSRNGTSFLLLYTARAQFAPSKAADPATDATGLRLRLVTREGKVPAVLVLFNGKPQAGVGLKSLVGSDAAECKSDDHGLAELPDVASGKAGLLAKYVEPASGTRDGKPYTEIRHYATLTVATASPTAAAPGASPTAVAQARKLATMPEAVNSFGGAVCGDWLYVYSGHTGETHKYHRGMTSTHFRRFNLRDCRTWEELPAGPSLQGVTLLAHRGALYRVGGMTARNEPGKPADLVSTASFARFDPETKTWTELTPLPAPRSTHDAVVVGDLLYVIGGWNMPGGEASNSEFLEDALVIDLTRPSAGWQPLPKPPFQRRALAVAERGGKIYAVGGLEDEGSVVRRVDIYDPATRTWSRGPDIPGGKIQGFAPSAFSVSGELYVSGSDGTIQRLSPAGDRWELAGQLAVPRMTHRLLPGIDGDVLAVGGTASRKSVDSIESLVVATH